MDINKFSMDAGLASYPSVEGFAIIKQCLSFQHGFSFFREGADLRKSFECTPFPISNEISAQVILINYINVMLQAVFFEQSLEFSLLQGVPEGRGRIRARAGRRNIPQL